uniref:Lipocalin/cytosolic fatty-acid binding domain-containing protein n=1 Tax=Poecilia reticulata TaxID=8081 RepID=A0A3P9Q2N7_POERE
MSTIIYVSGFVATWDVLTKLSFCNSMKEPLLTFTCSAKPNLIITRDKETISVEAKSTLKTDKIKFKLNEEFDEKTPDSRQVQSKFFLRNVTENGKLEVKCIMGEVVATRIYEKEA